MRDKRFKLEVWFRVSSLHPVGEILRSIRRLRRRNHLTKCFVCHHADPQVQELIGLLRRCFAPHDIELWVNDIFPAQDIVDRMERGVDEDCQVFLFIITPESVSSPYCETEWRKALETREKTGLQIVPLRLGETLPPEELGEVKHVDFRNGDNFAGAFKELLEGVKEAAYIYHLVFYLKHGYEAVRMGSAKALAEVRSPSTVSALGVSLETDESCLVRSQVAWALGEIGGERAAGLLAKYGKTRGGSAGNYC